ncbi:alanine racemase [Parvibaculum sp.]|uniref:alanine racemase n=1 Tax=Parvibaculum sp. TaxID=2024848 RepID=UPI00320E0F1B
MSLPEFFRDGAAAGFDPTSASTILTVDLDALAANYRYLRSIGAGADVAGVVKADAYGLGLAPIARTLAHAGCTSFFVTDTGEGMELRAALPGAIIYVTNGLMPGAAALCRAYDLRPCLGSLEEVEEWRTVATNSGMALPAALHFDTGLSRLGFGEAEAARLIAEPSLLSGIDVTLVMSHLACSDEPGHPLNAMQLARFRPIRKAFASIPASFANSGGALLGPDYCFDLIRSGYGLYGGRAGPEPSPFRPVVHLETRVLQVRDVPPGVTAGYGATWEAKGPRRLGVLATGYADGYFRSLATSGRVYVGGHYAPIAGRVSMDLLTIDLSDLPEGAVGRGDFAELIGPHVTLDEVADRAGTIGYEVLTSLGDRAKRLYTGGHLAVPES